jgi:hypothetical protein
VSSFLGTGGRSTVAADIRRHREAYYEEHPEAGALDAEAPRAPLEPEMSEEQIEEERLALWGH